MKWIADGGIVTITTPDRGSQDMVIRDFVVGVKNRFAKKTEDDYRDMLINLEWRQPLIGNGSQVTELQLHWAPVFEKKSKVHVMYEFLRVRREKIAYLGKKPSEIVGYEQM